MLFYVYDKQTGTVADVEKIARTEKWAQGLVYCDIEGFALTEDGVLMLCDECGNVAYCPPDRFDVVFYEGDSDYCDAPIIGCPFDEMGAYAND